jgi:hypothetical protein
VNGLFLLLGYLLHDSVQSFLNSTFIFGALYSYSVGITHKGHMKQRKRKYGNVVIYSYEDEGRREMAG